MEPITFAEANLLLTRPPTMTEDECSSLPVFTDGMQCICCWKLSFWDRIKILFTGRMWMSVLSGHTQPPVWMGVDYPFIKGDE